VLLNALILVRKCERCKLFAECVLLDVDFSASASEILKTICHWNWHGLFLHPRTCLEIRKLIRREVDDHVDVITVGCRASDRDEDTQSTGRQLSTVQIIYSEVADAGFLGKTLLELQVCCVVILKICTLFISEFVLIIVTTSYLCGYFKCNFVTVVQDIIIIIVIDRHYCFY